jgi:hypothetical protein
MATVVLNADSKAVVVLGKPKVTWRKLRESGLDLVVL